MTKDGRPIKRVGPHSNTIPLSFDKAVEGLLAVKPKKVTKPGRTKGTFYFIPN